MQSTDSGEKMSSGADEVVTSFLCSTGPGQHAKLTNTSNIDQETPEMKRGEFDSGWRVKFSEIKGIEATTYKPPQGDQHPWVHVYRVASQLCALHV